MDTTHSNPSPRLVEALVDHEVVEAEISLALRKLHWGNVRLFSGLSQVMLGRHTSFFGASTYVKGKMWVPLGKEHSDHLLRPWNWTF